MMMVSMVGVILGGWIFISQYRHLLVMLVSIELMALSLLFMMSSWFYCIGTEDFFMLVYLSLAVCEGSLGLAVLVSLVRSHGSDKFDSVAILLC